MSKISGMVLAVANQKGGAGKTTVAAHLAVEVARAGDGPVLVLDTDPQGTLSNWYNDRINENNPHRADDVDAETADMTRLAAQVAELRQQARVIIIDTPPSKSPAIAEVIGLADLVLVPLNPSPNDTNAVGPTLDICDEKGKKFVFVVNRAKYDTKLTRKTIATIAAEGPVSPAVIGARDNFAGAMADGRTLPEIEKSKGVEEIAELWAFVKGHLFGHKRGKA